MGKSELGDGRLNQLDLRRGFGFEFEVGFEVALRRLGFLDGMAGTVQVGGVSFLLYVLEELNGQLLEGRHLIPRSRA